MDEGGKFCVDHNGICLLVAYPSAWGRLFGGADCCRWVLRFQ